MTIFISRRLMLTGATALAGVAAFDPLLRNSIATERYSALITDARFEASRRLKIALDPHARRHVDVSQDLCAQWYGFLRETVARERAPMAGLTTWIDFIVMQGCAREAGLRSLFVADHRHSAAGVVENTTEMDLTVLSRVAGKSIGSLWDDAVRSRPPALPAPRCHMVSWVFG